MSAHKSNSWSKAFVQGVLDGLGAPAFLWEEPKGGRRYAGGTYSQRMVDAAGRAFNGVYQEVGPRGEDLRAKSERQGESFRDVEKPGKW